MAEFQILTVDTASGRKAGDIIDVKPDGFAWGSLEHLGTKRLIVSIQPMTAMEAQEYQGPLTVDGEIVERSRYAIDFSSVSLDAVGSMDWVVPVLDASAIYERGE